MEARLNSNVGSPGLQAALSRFPDKSVQIRQLLLGRESFRGLCDDLAVADEALGRVDMYSTDLREERRREYEELIEALVQEIREFLA
ncbi:hypothetical protein IB277_29950 [Ensifer sp. ENS07]|uniref:hypothetical protein n=1 Tax=Ensifer sp. ENS07 TaxID=2769274 RepID=UPI0017810709|nr:hypothetical protein [Ensifer sp. ENS07]MBD9640524.1 hypothetical protein [Ensifer sp. ENS07]